MYIYEKIVYTYCICMLHLSRTLQFVTLPSCMNDLINVL